MKLTGEYPKMIVAVGNPAHAIQIIEEIMGMSILLIDYCNYGFAAKNVVNSDMHEKVLQTRLHEKLLILPTVLEYMGVTTYNPGPADLERELSSLGYNFIIINCRENVAIDGFGFAHPIYSEKALYRLLEEYSKSRFI